MSWRHVLNWRGDHCASPEQVAEHARQAGYKFFYLRPFIYFVPSEGPPMHTGLDEDDVS